MSKQTDKYISGIVAGAKMIGRYPWAAGEAEEDMERLIGLLKKRIADLETEVSNRQSQS